MVKVLLLSCSIVLSLITAVFFGIALVLDEKLVAIGLDHEIVAPNVEFEGLRIGDSHTCVTLRRMSAVHAGWRSRETCYRMFPAKDDPVTTVLDLETGETLVLRSVCHDDGEWIAAKLGIPERLLVDQIWQKQCRGWRTISLSTQVLMAAFVIKMLVALLNDIENVTTREKRGGRSRSSWRYALPAVFGYASLLVWQHVLMTSDALTQSGWSLWLIRWSVVLWLMIVAIVSIAKRSAPVQPATEPSSNHEELPDMPAVGADPAENVETSSHALTDKQTTCKRRHWRCCDCGRAIQSSQTKRNGVLCKQRHAVPHVRVVPRKRGELAATSHDSEAIDGAHDSGDDRNQVDAPREEDTGLRQRVRPQ
ncbi:hypothetical protein PINS_up013915 [Pythium insidiosum]|nr:hypothetical protein PINS_up013915 [Pythium insidiosum]